MSKKLISAALVSLLTVSAVAQEAQTSAFDKIKSQMDQLVEENNVALWAELAMYESIIKSVEGAQFINEVTGIDKAHVAIVIPAALGSVLLAKGGYSVAAKTISTLTPDKAAWFNDFKSVKLAEKEANSALKNATREAADSALIETLKTNVKLAEGETAKMLLKKPGNLYRFGRLVRGAAKTSLVFGTIAMAAVATAEGTLLVIGSENLNDKMEQMKKDRDALKDLLLN